MGMRMVYYTLCFCEASCGVMGNNSMFMNLTMSGPANGVRRNIHQVVSLNPLAGILLKVLLDYYSLIFLAGIDLRLTV